MASIVIPLAGGAVNAHPRFTMQLGTNLLTFDLNYITVAGPAWSLDISREGEMLIPGAMLEPGAVISQPYEANIGRFVFTGLDVTLDNLGVDNQLVWIPDDE